MRVLTGSANAAINRRYPPGSSLTDYSESNNLVDMPRWSRANPLALAVLVCLYEKPMHPYEVAQTLRQRAKQESVRLNYGSLYTVVESLEKRGFIKATARSAKGSAPSGPSMR